MTHRNCLFAPLVACVASVSVRFRSKERGTRVKDCATNGASKRVGRGGEEVSFLPLPLPPHSFFGSRFISRSVKTENPLPRSFFPLEPNRNACYAGYLSWEAILGFLIGYLRSRPLFYCIIKRVWLQPNGD